jgi:hypothetical protein
MTDISIRAKHEATHCIVALSLGFPVLATAVGQRMTPEDVKDNKAFAGLKEEKLGWAGGSVRLFPRIEDGSKPTDLEYMTIMSASLAYRFIDGAAYREESDAEKHAYSADAASIIAIQKKFKKKVRDGIAVTCARDAHDILLSQPLAIRHITQTLMKGGKWVFYPPKEIDGEVTIVTQEWDNREESSERKTEGAY